LKRAEAKDLLRKSLTEESDEDRIRFLLEKHVVKPKILQ